MGDRYFATRYGATGYFTDSRTSTPRPDARAGTPTPKDAPTMNAPQTASSSSSPPYSTSSARVVRTYSLKKD